MIGTREEAQQLIRSKVIGADTLVWKKCAIPLLRTAELACCFCAPSTLAVLLLRWCKQVQPLWAERGVCCRSFGAWEHLEDVIDQLPGLSLA